MIYMQEQGTIKHTLMALSPAGTQADVDIARGLYEEGWWLEGLIAEDLTAVWHRQFFSHNYEVRLAPAAMVKTLSALTLTSHVGRSRHTRLWLTCTCSQATRRIYMPLCRRGGCYARTGSSRADHLRSTKADITHRGLTISASRARTSRVHSTHTRTRTARAVTTHTITPSA